MDLVLVKRQLGNGVRRNKQQAIPLKSAETEVIYMEREPLNLDVKYA